MQRATHLASLRPALRRSYSHYFCELRRCDFGSATDWLNDSVSGELAFGIDPRI